MPRILRVAAAQVGRIDRSTPRASILARLIALLEEAANQKVHIAVFPETTFSTFFPRYFIENEDELASYFEKEPVEGISQCGSVKTFFDKARELGVDVAIGYGEEDPEGKRWNTASYVSGKSGKTVGKYRKIHLPGTFFVVQAVPPAELTLRYFAGTIEPFSKEEGVTNQLEKRYFQPGNLGFNAFKPPHLKEVTGGDKSPIVGMLICNDRRWAEGWRVYGLQGVELMCIGYNTTAWAPQLWGIDPDSMSREDAAKDAMFHHKLVCQAHAYTNATFLVTSARCGVDDGIHPLISGSMIVDPEGHIIAENKTEEDELIVADIDLDACKQGKSKTFAFEKHRRIEHYGLITERAGVVEPDEPDL
ncbi:N-carbamoyl-D-amino-acid hydrolase, partial [Phenoliferia sp. Uapishka_3]